MLLIFTIRLRNFKFDSFFDPNGPLFHRWIPNGKNDAIDVPVKNKKNRITIWFDRHGYIDGGWVKYDRSKSEIDPIVMDRQCKLDAGPLHGEAVFSDISKEERAAVENNLQDSKEYVKLGKRIVSFLYPPVCNFISILKIQYGQYWIPDLKPWDSRNVTLGSYLTSNFDLHWSTDKGKSWSRFIPTQQGMTFHVIVGRDFTRYLTKKDWQKIKSSFEPDTVPSLAAVTLSKAHEFRGQGHLRQAFIEAVSALELAIAEYFRKQQKDCQSLSAYSQRFFELPNPVKLTLLGSLTKIVPAKTLEESIEAISLRNYIVHDGYNPSEKKSRACLDGLFTTVAALLETGEFKFPFLISGNEQRPPQEEDKK